MAVPTHLSVMHLLQKLAFSASLFQGSKWKPFSLTRLSLGCSGGVRITLSLQIWKCLTWMYMMLFWELIGYNLIVLCSAIRIRKSWNFPLQAYMSDYKVFNTVTCTSRLYLGTCHGGTIVSFCFPSDSSSNTRSFGPLSWCVYNSFHTATLKNLLSCHSFVTFSSSSQQ